MSIIEDSLLQLNKKYTSIYKLITDVKEQFQVENTIYLTHKKTMESVRERATCLKKRYTEVKKKAFQIKYQ